MLNEQTYPKAKTYQTLPRKFRGALWPRVTRVTTKANGRILRDIRIDHTKVATPATTQATLKHNYILHKMNNGEYHARYPLATYVDATLQNRWISITPSAELSPNAKDDPRH